MSGKFNISRMIASVRKLFAAQSGNVMITFALASVPLMGGVGAAVDYSKANSAKSALQGALDSAALTIIKSAAGLSSDQVTASATNHVKAAFNRSEVQNLRVSAEYDASSATLSVNAAGDMSTTFMGIMGISQMSVSGISKARMGGSTIWPVCVLVTDPESNHTLLVKNDASIDFTNCMVQVNTANWDAVEARDASYIHSVNGVNCFTGEIHYGDVKPPKLPTCTMLPDPYSSYDVPTNECTYTNLTISTDTTLKPGTYCGGINIKSAAQVTFSPGLYYIQNGDIQILGSSGATGNGVTFLISGSSSNININTTGTIALSPDIGSDAGKWAGFLFYYDQPSSTNNKKSAKEGKNTISSATVNVSGIIYLAGQKLNITDGAKVTVNPGTIIADFILPDNGKLSLTGTVNSATAAQQAMKKSIASTNPVLVK